QGTFREDLFYRLNVLPVTVPPLRDRDGDILFLAEHFLKEFAVELNFPKKSLGDTAREVIASYDFPGNVRELRNLIERLYILVSSSEISGKDIKPHLKASAGTQDGDFSFSLQNFTDARRDFDIKFLTYYLQKYNWNISLVADKLGMRQPNLSRKMKELGIRRA
nr:sigma-54-dependent Fis family transcriptional regulator [FCB group bacterium]